MKNNTCFLGKGIAFLIFLSIQGMAFGQSLYDVVISLTDRQHLLRQAAQVQTYLTNQTNDSSDPDSPIPEDTPIDWSGVGQNPTQSAVDGLDIGGKIALLNEAVARFDWLKGSFLNASPGEFSSGAVVGVLKPYTSADWDALPRATPENYTEVVRLLAQRVRALQLVQWPSAFRERSFIDETNIWEEREWDENGQPHVVLKTPEGTPTPASFDWNPSEIGPGNLHLDLRDPSTFVTPYTSSGVQVGGWHSINDGLHNLWIYLSGYYPEEARVSATAPGGDGVQIDGTVYIVRRSHWHEFDLDSSSSRYEKNQAGNVVEGSSSSGSIALFSSRPAATVNGKWVTYQEYTDDQDPSLNYSNQSFVEGGYEYKETSILPEDDPDHSNNFSNSYEQNWKIGCVFSSVLKPTFTRGVDAPGMRSKLEAADAILASNSADGAILLRPRPSLLFGIDLGPGLKGAGNGYITAGLMAREQGDRGIIGYGTPPSGWDPMARFDSTYSLQFAGSGSEYNVVYNNDRSGRSQSLPGLAWPYSYPDDTFTRYDSSALYKAWDSARLRQVVGRDLVADIVDNSSHYGGYTVNIYRRPTGSPAPTPGQAISVSGMTLIRTWTFSHPGTGGTPHPTDEEKLQVTGLGGEKYEIQANQVPSNQGLGSYGWYGPYAWEDSWHWRKGEHSWTLKLSQGTAEKLRKDIEMSNSFEDEDSSQWIQDVVLRESVDGVEISSLYSKTLDPFSVNLPEDWEITSAGKTITGTATLGDYQDPATRYGMLPTAVSIQYDGIQPDASYAWNASGLLTSFVQGPWSTSGAMDAGAFKQSRKFNGSTVSTDWIEFLEGGKKVKTYSAPDGSVGSKSGSSVAWSEVEYGTASDGLPGLPRIVKNSDGSGATYGWNANGDGSYILTLEQGALSGSSVSGGTKVIRDVNAKGQPNKIEFFSTVGGNLKTGGTVFSNFTAWGMPKTGTDHNTGLASTWDYSDGLSRLSTHTDSLGLASNFSNYDPLGRPKNISSNGISAANTYTAFSTSSDISGSATGTLSQTRDELGRLTAADKTWNSVTNHLAITPDGPTVGILHQSLLGTYNATVRKDDGTTSATSGPTLPFGGTTGTPVTVDNGLLKSTDQLSGQSAKFQTTWTDAWGRIRKTTDPTASGNGTTDYLYSDATSSLKRIRITEPTGRKTITETDPYNSAGAINRSGIDVNGDGGLGSSDRYIESVTKVSGGNVVTTLKLTENTGLREILSTEWTPSNNKTVTTINGGEETITRTPNYSTKTVTTTSSKGWSKTESFNNLGLTTGSSLTGTGIPSADLTPTWRPDGSLSGVTFTAGGAAHSATFNNDGTLATLNAPGRGNILGGHSISGGTETLTVDGTTITQKLDGTQTIVSGSEVVGKTETLAVNGSGFRQIIHPAAGSDTTVDYHASGDPSAKNYAAGTGQTNSYANGLLQTVSLARGGSLALGYSNDGAKDLTSAAWPAVTSGSFSAPAIVQGYDYDRAGRIKEIGDSSGVRSLAYQNGRASETVWNSGALAGYHIVKSLDASGRDTGFTLSLAGTVIHSVIKAPNGVSGEISGISAGTFSATYGRDAAHNLTSVTRNSVSQTWSRATGGRITAAGSSVGGAPAFTYTSFDGKDRRLNCTTSGGQWNYAYTNGQLTSATHPTLGSFSYSFDGIGRRTDKGSANTSDLLNRTLVWTNNQNKTLSVAAHPSSRVWVNGNEILNFTGSYSYPVPSPGASGGWVPWNTLAVLQGQGDVGAKPDAKAEQSGILWIPPVNETFTYDAAGNRESSALWDFGWDAKNQLVRARTKNWATAMQGYDITFDYDAEGRRFRKNVVRYKKGAIAEQKNITFVWDGWDLLYERQELPGGAVALERKYVWGPDIAGGAAGGAGGLLLIRETKGSSTTDLYPLYDGSGHVTALTDSTGTLQAAYSYGPFGELIHATGPAAQANPWRYATKYFDAETGLYYFGKRYLDPVTGQWLSREPLGETESLNLYSYCHNDPINNVDVLGLAEAEVNGQISNAKTSLAAIYAALAALNQNSSEASVDEIEGLYASYLGSIAGAQQELSRFQRDGWFMSYRGVDDDLSTKINGLPLMVAGMAPNRGQIGTLMAGGASLSSEFASQSSVLGVTHTGLVITEATGNGIALATGVGGLGVATGKIVAAQGIKAGGIYLAKQGAIAGGVMVAGYGLEQGMQAAGVAPEKAQMVMKGAELFVGLRALKLARMASAAESGGLDWVTNIAKGSRPHPATYMSVAERGAHASLFEAGAVRIGPTAPTGTIGRTETWVFPRSVVDDLVNQAGGDVAKLERLLGLDVGYLGACPVRVDIPTPVRIRIPTGNEFGANPFWRAGGRTSGGIPEAIIDPVPPGAYTIRPAF